MLEASCIDLQASCICWNPVVEFVQLISSPTQERLKIKDFSLHRCFNTMYVSMTRPEYNQCMVTKMLKFGDPAQGSLVISMSHQSC